MREPNALTNNAPPLFTGKAIVAKIIELMRLVPYIQKDAENKEQKYKYLSYEAVMEKLQGVLVSLKVVSLPAFETVEEREYSTAKGALWKYVRTKLTLQIVDIETGEYCIITGEGSGVDPGDKAVAKAQTMAMKNLWCKLLCVQIGEDPEADQRTDQQQFVSSYHQQPAAAPSRYGFPYHEEDIMYYYRLSGRDLNGLSGYIQQRYGRSPAQLTAEECWLLMNEFASYAQQKNGGILP